MSTAPFIISLPTADRQRSHAFYRDVFGWEAVGEPADDGVPEPLQYDLAPGVRLMLIPTGGFGWVLGGQPAAPAGNSECILNVPVPSDAAVDELVRRAVAAGASIVTEPGPQPWGFAGTFTDPDGHFWMLTSGPFPN